MTANMVRERGIGSEVTIEIVNEKGIKIEMIDITMIGDGGIILIGQIIFSLDHRINILFKHILSRFQLNQ
jgi:hypothetical protein